METLVDNIKKMESHNVDDLYNAVLKTENAINEFVEFNEYKFKKSSIPKQELDGLLFKERAKLKSSFLIPRLELKRKLDDLTLNERRKLKKSINIFHYKKSIASANRFLHYLYKEVFKIDIRIKITYPEKRLLIATKREIYLKYRAEMKKALKEYKEEKGDYFKLRLANGKQL